MEALIYQYCHSFHCFITAGFCRFGHSVNPFLANAPILYPLKTPENQSFSGVFRGYKMGILTRNGLRK